MEKSRNILAWLGQSEEKQMINDALVHVKKSMECVRELYNCLEALNRNDHHAKERAIANIKRAEREGDEIRRRMMEELSRGMLFPPDREDLMFLNDSLNDIADNAKGVARLLEFLKEPPSQAICRELQNDGMIAVKAVERLEQAISALVDNNISKALENCAQIETLEEEGDDKKREMLGLLLASNLAAPLLLILFQVIDMTEKVIDCIDNAGDLVRVLAIKAR